MCHHMAVSETEYCQFVWKLFRGYSLNIKMKVSYL